MTKPEQMETGRAAMNPFEAPTKLQDRPHVRPLIMEMAMRATFIVVLLPIAALISVLIFLEYGFLWVGWIVFFLLSMSVFALQQWLFGRR